MLNNVKVFFQRNEVFLTSFFYKSTLNYRNLYSFCDKLRKCTNLFAKWFLYTYKLCKYNLYNVQSLTYMHFKKIYNIASFLTGALGIIIQSVKPCILVVHSWIILYFSSCCRTNAPVTQQGPLLYDFFFLVSVTV